jgi:hypothetical protein
MFGTAVGCLEFGSSPRTFGSLPRLLCDPYGSPSNLVSLFTAEFSQELKRGFVCVECVLALVLFFRTNRPISRRLLTHFVLNKCEVAFKNIFC